MFSKYKNTFFDLWLDTPAWGKLGHAEVKGLSYSGTHLSLIPGNVCFHVISYSWSMILHKVKMIHSNYIALLYNNNGMFSLFLYKWICHIKLGILHGLI